MVDHDHKKSVIQNHFAEVSKRGPPRHQDINWDNIPVPARDLSDLGAAFTEEEVRKAVFDLPRDKAPGPDGFSGAFFKECWEIIKDDIMIAVTHFSNLHTSNLHWLNSANIALIPKKDGAECISDFRPISLIHAIAKILTKVLATRLAPHMDQLVSSAQSAFIKKRSIHDNFTYVRNLARKLHRNRTPTLLFKLDIKKAFDSVRWDFLMDLLRHLGFLSIFRYWVSALLSTATSRVLINGVVGDPMKHGCGLRQGDPLSPLLFVLAIDPLHHLLNKATAQGHLQPICGSAPTIRTSLYADDAAIFVKPTRGDVQFLASSLAAFGEVTGLHTNCTKSLVAPIRCDNINLEDILEAFPAVRTAFPMRYLGLPLSVKRLKSIHFQHLVDKVACKLPPWQGRHVATAGRVVLVKAVLTAIAIYHLTSLDIPVEILNVIDRLRRAYLWEGTDKVSGGSCKINWDLACKPKQFGGLGVLNLNKFAKALRL